MKYNISDFIDIGKTQPFIDSFCEVMGIASAIIDLDGTVLISSNWQKICTDFHRVNPQTRLKCIKSDTILANKIVKGEKYTIYQCHNGLIDAAAPIMIEGEHIANFFIGQFLFKHPEVEYFRKHAHKYGFDKISYLDALSAVPIVPKKRIKPILDFLTGFAKFLGEMGLRQLKQLEATDMLLYSERELTIRNQIANIFLTIPDERMYKEVLGVILEVMESKHGIFGYMEEDGSLVCPSLTRGIWEQCNVPDKKIVFPKELMTRLPIWSQVLIKKKKVCINRPVPVSEEHIPIQKIIIIPLMYTGDVIGAIVVANKKKDYNKEDIQLMERIANHITPILNARLQRDRQESARKKAEETLRKRTKALESSNKELEHFAYVASHDLQEPLRMVSSYVQLLAQRYEGKLDADADDFIGFAVDGVNRMQILINDLLIYSRLGTRGKPLIPIDCKDVLEQTLINLKVAIEKSSAVITYDVLPTL